MGVRHLKWLEISVPVESEETATVIRDLFDLYGQGGAVEEQIPDEKSGCTGGAFAPITVKTYLSLDGNGEERRQTLERELSRLAERYPIPPARFRELREEDWATAWKAFFQPRRIGQHLVLKLPDQQFSANEDDVVIDLEPGMAFGTGLHATTRMCLERLEQLVRPGDRLLDMGTGSGVLAIAAAKLGAREILALDVDPTAVAVARDNVSLNGLSDVVHVEEGSIEYLLGQAGPLFDGVVMNIITEIIVGMMERGLCSFLRPGGWLVASGILASAGRQVREVFERCGLRDISWYHEEDWVTLCGVTGPSDVSRRPGGDEA
jgi:ribosomal protein L11 methyltransferase